MNFKDVLKERIHHDLGFDFYTKDNYPEATFEVIVKEQSVIAGTIFIPTIVRLVNDDFFLEGFSEQGDYKFEPLASDGKEIISREVIFRITGNANVLLKSERTICNIISELSGIATHVRKLMSQLQDSSVFLLDTRKNDPLLRPEHKYAIRIGGAKNHRAGFFDGILIKDNDIATFGSIKAAINNILKTSRLLTRVEIEISNLNDLNEVLCDPRIDAILLDNMNVNTLKKAVQLIREAEKQYIVEASGIREEQVLEVSKTGVDFISMSSLVRKASYTDVSMKLTKRYLHKEV